MAFADDHTMTRRAFVAGSVGTLAAAGAAAQTPAALPDLPALWDVDRTVANLENAYWGVMPREIDAEYLEHSRFLNRRNTVFVRDAIPGRERTAAMEAARAAVGRLLGAPASEPALTRNGTESLQHLILPYGRMTAGRTDRDTDRGRFRRVRRREQRPLGRRPRRHRP